MEDRMKEGMALAMVLALGLLLRFYLASLDMTVLLPNLLSDDVFYYLKVAGNIASGVGASFDGINPTNGFHPMYALFLSLFYSLGSFGLEAPVRFSLMLLSVFDVLTGFVVYRIMLLPSFGSSRRAALVACMFWVFNPFVVSGTFYGLETAMAVFLISIAVYSYVKTPVWAGFGGSLRLGVLLVAAMLARMDSVFLAAALASDMLARKRFTAAFGTLAVAAVVCSPWLLWSYASFGMIQQDSGAVLSYINGFNAGDFMSASYVAAKLGGTYLAFRIAAMFFASMALPLAFLLALRFFGGIEFGFKPRRLLLNFLSLFGLLLAAYYPMLMWGVTRRYYQPLLLLCALFVGLAFNAVARRRGAKMQALFVSLMLANLLFVGCFYWLYRPASPQSWHLELYGAAQWISLNTPPSSRVGGFNSGIVGYFSNRTVTNLDGVINHNAYLAIVDRRLFDYVKSQNISYLVDGENTFNGITPFMGDQDYKMKLREVYRSPLAGREGEYVVVYEVLY